MNPSAECFVCGHGALGPGSPGYAQCPHCGHETLAEHGRQAFIVNDILEPPGPPNALDRFKERVLSRALASGAANSLLLDVGSASGRFLWFSRDRFLRAAGLEISPQALQYSRELGLDVRTSVEEMDGAPSVITCWHSLEHFPRESLLSLLACLQRCSSPDARLIVSVPDAASLQCRMLGTRYPYRDVPAHLHQFTDKSLDILLARHGFIPSFSCFSSAYSAFGWLQGLMNIFETPMNYYYYRKKRGHTFGLDEQSLRCKDRRNLALVGLCALPALAMTCFEALIPVAKGVLTRCYQRKPWT